MCREKKTTPFKYRLVSIFLFSKSLYSCNIRVRCSVPIAAVLCSQQHVQECTVAVHVRTQLSCSSLRSINISCNIGPGPLVKSATSFLTCSCCFSFNIGFSVSKYNFVVRSNKGTGSFGNFVWNKNKTHHTRHTYEQGELTNFIQMSRPKFDCKKTQLTITAYNLSHSWWLVRTKTFINLNNRVLLTN